MFPSLLLNLFPSLILFVVGLLKNKKNTNECTAGDVMSNVTSKIQSTVAQFPGFTVISLASRLPRGLHKRSVACSCNLVAPNVDWTLLKQVNAVYSVQIEGVWSLCWLLISTDGKCTPCFVYTVIKTKVVFWRKIHKTLHVCLLTQNHFKLLSILTTFSTVQCAWY